MNQLKDACPSYASLSNYIGSESNLYIEVEQMDQTKQFIDKAYESPKIYFFKDYPPRGTLNP